jgi:protoporphyrinogen oxidase
MNIGIIGGGIAGLSAAYELGKKGHKVAVFEKEAELGGQAATFEVAGERLERFYHHIFSSDIDIRQLIDELGLGERVVWMDSKVGFLHQGRIYDFVTSRDLLRFRPVGWMDRVRLGLVALYLRRNKNWSQLEGRTAQEWMTKYAGRRNYNIVWGPLLKNKFGASADEVGMVWLWGKIHLRFASRDKGRERLGYLRGSFGLIIDALEKEILANGGEIHISAPVNKIMVEDEKGEKAVGLQIGKEVHPFDGVIATVPSPTFLGMLPQLPTDYARKLEGVRYQAAVCLVLTLNRPLSHIYWLNISDPTIPFVAVVEHTNFVDPSNYGGKRIVYISNYVSKDSPLYQLNADELLTEYLPHLRKVNPRFDPSWIEERFLFREEAGQPVITRGYSSQIPEHRTPIPHLYLANTTQIYPEDRGMNYSVRLGLKISGVVAGED